MAGYPKIWTRIRHRPWFRKLRGSQRLIWYEVIMIAKEQTDDGWVCFPNISGMALECGVDRSSVRGWLERETGQTWDGRVANVGDVRVVYGEKSPQVLQFYLTEYNESQEVTSFRELKSRALRKEKEREGKEREVEYVSNLKALKIDRSIFEEYKKEIPSIDHDDELRKADLWRMDNPAKSKKPNDHLFLRNWFQRAKKGKDEKGESDLSKYDDL